MASGESAQREEVEKLRGRCRVIVVNTSYQLAPWADVLYAADRRWWEVNAAGVREFAGLKVGADREMALRLKIACISILGEGGNQPHRITVEKPGVIGHGGNSAFQALNLAVQFGSRRILLLGVDFCGEHWHGKHEAPLRNPREAVMMKWRERLDEQAPVLCDLGVTLINCSRKSRLTAYPKMTVDDALG